MKVRNYSLDLEEWVLKVEARLKYLEDQSFSGPPTKKELEDIEKELPPQ